MLADFQLIVGIAGCGAIGALARYYVSGWAHQVLGAGFPFGTLLVNVLGCFAIGGLAHLGETTTAISPHTRMVVGVGLLGAFTTFSTFGYETVRYLEDAAWQSALCNVTANVVVGVLAVWGGTTVARFAVGGA